MSINEGAYSFIEPNSRGTVHKSDGTDVVNYSLTSAKILSSIIECRPARKHLEEFRVSIVFNGDLWKCINEDNSYFTNPELVARLYEDPECRFIFDDLGLMVTV